jgi:tetratricopeptide (TPR) repeat protein
MGAAEVVAPVVPAVQLLLGRTIVACAGALTAVEPCGTILAMPDQEDSPRGDSYNLSGDFRGAIVNIETTITGTQAIEMPPRPGIFISYSWKDDKPFVERLHADLETAGFDVWRDERDLPGRGPDLPDELCLAIDECDRFLPVIGPAAFRSPMVQGEWAYARDKCKPVTAVWRLGEEMPPDFGRKLYVDFRAVVDDGGYAAQLAALQRALRKPEFPPGPLLTALPIPPQGYIERAEFDRLAGLFRPGFQRAAITGRAAAGTLHAAGGLGKTILAAIFARDCDTRRRFPQGVVWLAFGKTPDVAALQAEAGRALGDDPREYTDVAAGRTRLQRVLAGRRVLLVLDDVWDYRHAEALLVDAPDCRWLVTTRKGDLGSDLGLSPGQIIPLDYLSDDEGLALIAGRLGLDPAEAYPDRETHRAIARELGGYTQGIAIAAARLAGGQVTATTLLGRYRARRDDDPFRDLQLPGEERERNLELSFKESYDDLDEADRRRFRALGVFAPEGTFSAAAAAAVWADDLETTEDALARLVSAAMLVRAGDERFSQHNLLRAYSLALLGREGEEEAAKARHYDHLYEMYSDHDRNQINDDPQWYDKIAADFANIKHALAWALKREPQRACRLIDALEDTYIAIRESTVTRRHYLEQAHQAAITAGNRYVEANTIKALGDVELQLANYETARARYEEARPIYEGIGARLGAANTIQALGDVELQLANYETARARYEEARPIYEGIGDRPGLSNVFFRVGQILWQQGDLEAAETSIAQAVALNNQFAPGGPVTRYFTEQLDALRNEIAEKRHSDE